MRAQVLSGTPPAIDTPQFRQWFGDSKIVDDQGKPLVVYHGTAIAKEQFRRDGGCAGCGAYFTSDHAVAQDYAEGDAAIDGDTPIVLAVYLAIQNPYVTDFVFDRDAYDEDADPQSVTKAFRDRLEAAGYDGIHIRNTREYVAFRPEQVKLALGNIGTFDPADPRIAFKRIEAADATEEEGCAPRF